MLRQSVLISGDYSPTTDVGVVICDTTNDVANILLPSIINSNADQIGYQVVIQDGTNSASINNIVITSVNGELINGLTSVTIDTNGGAIMLVPFASKYWIAYPIGGGGSDGLLEVPLTFLQSGTNYFAKMSSIVPLIGNASSFSIIPVVGGADQLVSNSKIVKRVSVNYYLQIISQPSGARAFGSLFGGARASGGAVGSAIGINNFRMALPIQLGYVPVNGLISSNVNWSGAGTLTLNGATLLVEF
jgi:hypothetical protein